MHLLTSGALCWPCATVRVRGQQSLEAPGRVERRLLASGAGCHEKARNSAGETNLKLMNAWKEKKS